MPLNNPTIDILLAVHNGERYLRPFMESLVTQSFRDFRLVVGNNRSTDATADILEAYRERLAHEIVVIPLPDEFLSAHANFARVTEAGNAPYSMYADADDVWHADKVEKTLTAMKKAEQLYGVAKPILVHADLTVVDENLRRIHSSLWRYQFIDPSRTRLNQLLLQNCVTGCTVMLNRALADLGRPIPGDAFVHDHWYALVASAFGHIVMIEEPLIEYRQHGNNVTGAKRWGIRYVLKRAMRLFAGDGARESLERNITQARAFSLRFGDRLNEAQKNIIVDFVTIREQSAISRRRTLVRNGFWKKGLARNVGLFLAI